MSIPEIDPRSIALLREAKQLYSVSDRLDFADGAIPRRLLSVPKILTPFIPEILARPAMAGRTRNLSVLRLVRRAGRREEDVGNAKTTRSRNLVEGRSPEDGG